MYWCALQLLTQERDKYRSPCVIYITWFCVNPFSSPLLGHKDLEVIIHGLEWLLVKLAPAPVLFVSHLVLLRELQA